MPQTSLDHTSLEFVLAFQNRVQQALDRGREGQIQFIRDMSPRRDATVQFQVGQKAWLKVDECSIHGNKHFKIPWTGQFPILAVTPSTATLDIPEHWRLLSNTFHFDKLLPARQRPAEVAPPDVSPPAPPVLIQDGQSWYEVDEVVKHAWRGRRQQERQLQLHYLVRFKGSSDAYDVWRPATLLIAHGAGGCSPHIARYHHLFNIPLPPRVGRRVGGG
jgi:hypothetical protein